MNLHSLHCLHICVPDTATEQEVQACSWQGHIESRVVRRNKTLTHPECSGTLRALQAEDRKRTSPQIECVPPSAAANESVVVLQDEVAA